MKRERGTVLIVDDDDVTREQIAWALESEHRVLQARHPKEAREAIASSAVDVVLLDLHLPPRLQTPEEGIRLLEAIRARNEGVAVIVMTGDRERQTALDCVARGAADFFEKPLPMDELRLIVARALKLRRLEQQVEQLRQELARPDPHTRMVGRSAAMQRVAELVHRVADTHATVLIRGESGTGKELVARALHQGSSRRAQRFVALHCSALPGSLVDDELFGHERGAFTGAHGRRIGRFEYADGGTLFLDEIGELPVDIQVKLLRVLQEGEFERIGGTECIRVDVRLVSATHRDLEQLVREGCFREDLYYRLDVLQIELPPLRERKEDVPLLVEHFLRKHGRGRVRRVSDDAMAFLQDHSWPGNVRELENVLEAAEALCTGDTIRPLDLPPAFGAGVEAGPRYVSLPEEGLALRDVERQLVLQALERTQWNQTRAAKLLHLTRPMLIQRMKRHGLRPPGSSRAHRDQAS
ncbi:MAG: sigma-54-dependent transcriptional regulator [Candidatus Krumholzibacteriia bacterium]